MFDVAGPLLNALNSARDELGAAATSTARARTPYGGSRSDAAMAGVAERAIFTEALMNALHARLAEVKGATRA
jgi:hypothetical protein